MPITIPRILPRPPTPASSTVDHFRTNIYRPRLALLLLLLILSPHNAPSSSPTGLSSPAASSSAPPAAATHTDNSNWAINIIDGLVVAAPSPSPSPSASTSPQSPPQPAPGSIFTLPKPSWGLLVDQHVLPALVPLHALWGVRFLAMAIEDAAATRAIPPAHTAAKVKAITAPALQLVALFVFAISVALPPTIDAIAEWCIRRRVTLGIDATSAAPSATSSSSSSSSSTGLLPLKLLVALELFVTLAALISALFKLDDVAQLGFLPKTVRLPSPSHSPSIVELLPLPPSLAAALSGSTASVTSSRPPGAARGTRGAMGGLTTTRTGRRPLLARAMDLPVPAPAPAPAAAPAPTSTGEATTEGSTAAETANGEGAAPSTGDDDDEEERGIDVEPAPRQQIFRAVGTDGRQVLRSTSVAQPIAPLRLTADDLRRRERTTPEQRASIDVDVDAGASTSPAPSPLPAPSASRRTTHPVRRRIKAPRLSHQRVSVSSRWLAETLVSLGDKLVGSLLYATVTLHLPTLSPTSLPPVVSLLSLRSELSALTNVWSQARARVECLEFVRRRWGVELPHRRGVDPYRPELVRQSSSGGGEEERPTTNKEGEAAAGRKTRKRKYAWMSYDETTCCICFDATRPDFSLISPTPSSSSANLSSTSSSSSSPQDKEKRERGREDKEEAGQGETQKWYRFCRLDCGHELHDTCLVTWLTAQAFCPTCHVVLSFSPPPPSPSPSASDSPSSSSTTTAVATAGEVGEAEAGQQGEVEEG